MSASFSSNKDECHMPPCQQILSSTVGLELKLGEKGMRAADCSSPEASIVRPAPVGPIGVCKAASAAAVTKAAATVAEAAPAVCKAAAERGCIHEAAATIPKAVAAAFHWVAVIVPVIAATSKATCMPCLLELSAKQSARVLRAPCEQSEAQLDIYLGRSKWITAVASHRILSTLRVAKMFCMDEGKQRTCGAAFLRPILSHIHPDGPAHDHLRREQSSFASYSWQAHAHLCSMHCSCSLASICIHLLAALCSVCKSMAALQSPQTIQVCRGQA